jgi:hypothetical protein
MAARNHRLGQPRDGQTARKLTRMEVKITGLDGYVLVENISGFIRLFKAPSKKKCHQYSEQEYDKALKRLKDYWNLPSYSSYYA